ncbi:MAG: hypothetical protein J6X03_03640 [Bacilli bacterium]|nr:hypothetical protein [Bacilli bacterium]
MNYGYGKTYRFKDGFTALNGCVQYYEVEVAEDVDSQAKYEAIADKANPTEAEILAVEKAKANLLRTLEVLRTYGGQPIITKVEGPVVKFTLEQANVYGDAAKKQPSEKDLINDAKAKIAALFTNIKTVDLEWKTVDGERKLVEKASTTDLFVSADVEEVIF